MSLDDHAVDENVLEVELVRQGVENTLEDARERPEAEALEALFQLPKRSGRSRQGDAVRDRQRTASRNRRLSAAVTPGSVAFPGSMCSVRAHMASVSTVLSAFI